VKFASLLGLLLALAGCTGGATIRITGRWRPELLSDGTRG